MANQSHDLPHCSQPVPEATHTSHLLSRLAVPPQSRSLSSSKHHLNPSAPRRAPISKLSRTETARTHPSDKEQSGDNLRVNKTGTPAPTEFTQELQLRELKATVLDLLSLQMSSLDKCHSAADIKTCSHGTPKLIVMSHSPHPSVNPLSSMKKSPGPRKRSSNLELSPSSTSILSRTLTRITNKTGRSSVRMILNKLGPPPNAVHHAKPTICIDSSMTLPRTSLITSARDLELISSLTLKSTWR